MPVDRIITTVAGRLNIREEQAATVLQLTEEGATVPFLARYRKEQTGGLDEEQLRNLLELYSSAAALASRRAAITAAMRETGVLTAELQQQIEAAVSLTELEDIYLPYRPKRRTRASDARDRGLEPLAELLLADTGGRQDPLRAAKPFISEEKGVSSAAEAVNGALDIIAERISETAAVRRTARSFLQSHGRLQSSRAVRSKPAKNARDIYRIYHEFSAPLKSLKPHQTLAINRGEKEKFLSVSITCDREQLHHRISAAFFSMKFDRLARPLQQALTDGTARLLLPALDRELRRGFTAAADRHAIGIFSANLQQLLLQPPVRNKIILGIDPGFVSGCKAAVIDQTGRYLEGATLYPHPPQQRQEEALRILRELINRHKVSLVVIGNGTASRETEQLVAGLIKQDAPGCRYLITSEAGASVYSASPLAREEFPDLEAAQRGNISIARRVLDPLAELVKIEPRALGVGLYQHDVDQHELQRALDAVVESCVNRVGVDLNTASEALLARVSGLTKKTAQAIIARRSANGAFKTRAELAEVPGIGPKAFQQAAGFLRIPNGSEPLDNTGIHPESFPVAYRLLEKLKLNPAELHSHSPELLQAAATLDPEALAAELNTGVPTLLDILENLKKPGRDPRDENEAPLLRSDILKFEDLREGMELEGTVRNVVDFGAFVDIGVKQDGLIHISAMPGGFHTHPLEVLHLGQIVRVRIRSLDPEQERIGLELCTEPS